MELQTRNLICDDLPDGRLSFHSYEPGLATFRHRAGHVHPDLLADVAEYGRHYFRGLGFSVDPGRVDEPPDWEGWRFDRVRPELLPLRTCFMRATPHSVLVVVRADMMSREMCEMLSGYESDLLCHSMRLPASALAREFPGRAA
ncbi:hypothetical protein ACH5AI_18690 [Streptomyces collinus]|uniref:hypothetical protein n=1 Tax=Streptomyces collinus TaxID=42684 RepID=UPI0037AE9591